jgi:nucleoside-diphosphate-sugar epimerase
MNKAATVTGASGFIGSHLAKFLQAKGWKVIGGPLTRLQFIPEVAEHFVQYDLHNGPRMEQHFKRYEPIHVFHLGAEG